MWKEWGWKGGAETPNTAPLVATGDVITPEEEICLTLAPATVWLPGSGLEKESNEVRPKLCVPGTDLKMLFASP